MTDVHTLADTGLRSSLEPAGRVQGRVCMCSRAQLCVCARLRRGPPAPPNPPCLYVGAAMGNAVAVPGRFSGFSGRLPGAHSGRPCWS